jgi:predicted GNAT family acetyltransferase
MHIERYAHDEGNEFFWSKMGRFFASPAVRNAVGGFMTSGPQFTWWVAFDDEGQVLGFCAAKREKKTQIYLTYAYVLPEYRGQGVYTALFLARLQDVLLEGNVTRMYAVCNLASEGIFLNYDFAPCGTRGSYTIVERLIGESA